MRERWAVLAALVLCCAVGCAGSGTPEQHAVDDAGPRVRERAATIIELFQQSVSVSRADGAEVTAGLEARAPELYESNGERPLTMSFLVRSTGSDGGWGNGTRSVGGCFSLSETSPGSPVGIETVPCPREVRNENGRWIDVEIDVVPRED